MTSSWTFWTVNRWSSKQINTQADNFTWADFNKNKQIKGTLGKQIECFRDSKLVRVLIGNKLRRCKTLENRLKKELRQTRAEVHNVIPKQEAEQIVERGKVEGKKEWIRSNK